jgi:glycerophosphoryl diester phosphodiesterase
MRTTVTAQAGSLGTRPNTRESFILALSHSVDFLEANIRFGINGRIYLSHEILSTRDQAEAMQFSELLQIASGDSFVRLHLNMKEFTNMHHLENQIKDAGLTGRVFLTGVPLDQMQYLFHDAPTLPAYLNAIPTLSQQYIPAACDNLIHQIRNSGAIGLNTNFRCVTELLLQEIIESELLLSVWAVDQERDMRRMLAMPVNNIITRRIDTLINLRSRIAQPRLKKSASRE